MGQELTSKVVAVIGSGPAGCMCAKILQDAGVEVILFEKNKILNTILPTGGGKCNLAPAIFDYKELAGNYPRGEKFLYSIFSKFGVSDTIDFFNSIGVKTYTRDDNRIFPVSNSAKDVRTHILNSLQKAKFVKEKVEKILQIKNNSYKIQTAKKSYIANFVVIAIGGHTDNSILGNLDISKTKPVPSLVGLKTKEDFSTISGVKLQNINVKIDDKTYTGDLLFTHKGVSGPVIYTISSIYARKDFPYNISIKFANTTDFQNSLNNNPKKTIENVLKTFMPKSLVKIILDKNDISCETRCSDIKKTERTTIGKILENYKLEIIGTIPKGEVVTCGGVKLDEIDSKTLESKKHPHLYFCGEILDIDGFCGGFNLQNCWSTGYVAAKSIIHA